MEITYQTVVDEDGKPEAAIIPWNVFLTLRRLVDDETPTREEIEAADMAEADRRNGNKDAFVSLAELEIELGI